MNAAANSEVVSKTRSAALRNGIAANRTRFNGAAEARAESYQVTQPVLLKRLSTFAAILLSLRAATPAAVSSLTLYGLSQAFGLQSTQFLSALTVLVTVLSIV